MIREHDWINSQTGEEASGLLIIKGGRYTRGMAFMTMFADGWRDLAAVRLTGTEWRILAVLLSHLDFSNAIGISQATIAEELKLKPSNVSRAINRLVEKAILSRDRDEADPRRKILRFNVHLGWKGRPKDWNRAIEARMKPPQTSNQDDINRFAAKHLRDEQPVVDENP